MTPEERAMLAREARRLGNQIIHRRKMIAKYEREIPALDERRDEILERLADDTDEDE